MNIELNLNKIKIDTSKLHRLLLPIIVQALEASQEKLIELMEQEIDNTSSAPHDWREELKRDLQRVEEIFANDYVEYKIGPGCYQEGADSGAWMRAMVIAYGMGVKGLNNNQIFAGPEGRIVWDKDLDSKIPSKVKYSHEIPDSWYHAGGQFIENAILNMQKIFIDICESAFESGIVNIRNCIVVTPRS